MIFGTSFCDPLKPNIIELGDRIKEQVITEFEKINWNSFLQKMKEVDENNIYYSPSYEVHNKDTQHGLAISAVGDPDKYEFYIFYKRPKKIKWLFGLTRNQLSQITGQTRQDVLDCLKALVNNNTTYLETKIR